MTLSNMSPSHPFAQSVGMNIAKVQKKCYNTLRKSEKMAYMLQICS